jgi:predicted transcriptional regulator
MIMLEDEIKKVMLKKKITAVDVYRPVKINRVNFYKAIKTSNLKNKSLKKILNFLGLEIKINLYDKKNENKKRIL